MKIGKALGTGTLQRVVTEQPRPFEVDVAEAAFASQSVTTSGEFIRATPLSEDPQSTVSRLIAHPERSTLKS